jgi:hypothetical protein
VVRREGSEACRGTSITCRRPLGLLSTGSAPNATCIRSLSFLSFLTEGAVDRLWYGAAAEAAATNTSTKQRGLAVERVPPTATKLNSGRETSQK